MLRYFLVFFLILTGCSSNHTELSTDLAHVVVDYQSWIYQNETQLQENLDKIDGWEHDVVGIAQQSWESTYFEEHGWTGEESTAAYARSSTGKIALIVTHPVWNAIREDYDMNRDFWLDNEPVGDLYVWQFGLAVGILCHENAHNIFIESHEDVYTIGEACLELWIEENE